MTRQTSGSIRQPPSHNQALPAAHVTARTHDHEHLLLWQARGTSSVQAGDERCRLRRGWALWVPAGIVHAVSLNAHSVLLPVLLPAESDHPLEASLQRVALVEVGEELATLLLADVQRNMSILGPEAELSPQIRALVDRGRHLNVHPELPTSPAALVVAGAWRRDPGDPRSLMELARLAHTSVRTVERQFLAETGMTARRWRLENRMEAAAALLRSPTPVATVARRVGYTDASAFGRAFRSHLGMPPGQYASAVRPRDHEPLSRATAPCPSPA